MAKLSPALRIRNQLKRRSASGVTRKELSAITGLAHQRVSEVVRDLVVEGVAVESANRRDRATVLYPNWQA